MAEARSFVFIFDEIEVREREFSIVRSGAVLAVEPKAFRVLLFLLRHPHRLVKKDELLDAVWNDCAVSENSLTRSIALLRRLLGDDIRNPRYIGTVPTVGYRFLCDVTVAEDGGGGELPGARVLSIEPQSAMPDANAAIAVQAETASTTHPAVSEDGFHWKPSSWLWIVPSLAVLIAAGFLYRGTIARHHDNRALPLARMRIVPLTKLAGAVRDPAFSPDGEKVAFVWDGENPVRGDLYVQLVGAERPLRLTHTLSGFTCCADWSRNGREILFGRCDDQGGAVYSVPAMGGAERRLTTVACHFGYAGYPKWSADGRSILLIDRCTPAGADSVMLFSLDTGAKQCLSAAPAFSQPGDLSPTLSPDGKTIAFLRRTSMSASEVYTMPAFGGSARRITHEALTGFNLMWSADGRRLLCYSPRRGLPRVWQVDPESGAIKPEAVYPGTGTLSHDGKRLAYVDTAQLNRSSTLLQLSLSQAGGHVVSQRSMLPGDPGIFGPQPSPDGGKFAFESCRTGTCEIWSQADGSDPLQLTSFEGTFPGTPRWSADGRWIAFDNILGTHSQVFLVDSEGRNVHPVTSGNYLNIVPSWSRDGKSIFFASNRTRNWEVWRKVLATGQETQVTQHGGFAAFESFDRTMIYYSRFDSGGLWSIPAGGGEEHQVTDALHIGYWGYFAVTEPGIYLLDADAVPKPTVLFYDFRTRLLKPVLELTLDPLPWSANLAASRDGRTLYLVQGKQHNSLILAENFQQEAW